MEPGFDHYQALAARDTRFDGLFFVGVKTTGIYCRPVCGARTPRRDSCVFLDTAAAAERAGFRPCLRCRPELAPAAVNPHGAPSLEHALFATVRARVAAGASASDLVAATGFSNRQLRRLLGRAFGVTPVEIVQTERLLFAKKLLQETRLPMIDVAFGAGFRSLRRFNALFRSRYGLAPSALRRAGQVVPRRNGDGLAVPADALTLRLAYRPPLAWREFLHYLVRRVVPGVEWAGAASGVYGRTVSLGGKVGWVLVQQATRGENALHVHAPPALSDVLWPLLSRLRGVFDLDADPARIDAALGTDPFLAVSVRDHPGLRVPGGWDTFELAVRAVLGQQISVAGATTLAGRLASRFGAAVETPFAALGRLAPTPERLAEAPVEEIAALGIARARAETLRALATAATGGELDFRPGTDIAAAVAALRRVRGIGEWTAQYVAMRALRFPDAFPSADLGLRKALTPSGQTSYLGEKHILARAEVWRPWRAYAAVRLWHGLGQPSAPL